MSKSCLRRWSLLITLILTLALTGRVFLSPCSALAQEATNSPKLSSQPQTQSHHQVKDKGQQPPSAQANQAEQESPPEQPSFVTSTCKKLPWLNKADTSLPAQLKKRLFALIKNLDSPKPIEFQELFHKRMRLPSTFFQRIAGLKHSLFGLPVDTSVFRIWRLDMGSDASLPVFCPDPASRVYGLYGYKTQYSIWLQIVGQKELGRVHTVWADTPEGWKIGFLHVQQWTHAAKDPRAWVERAIKDMQGGKQEQLASAYMKLDIASKLLRTGKYLEMLLTDEVRAYRDQSFGQEQWTEFVTTQLNPPLEVGYVSTSFAQDGLGLLMRLKVSEEQSMPTFQSYCKAITKRLAELSWANDIAGLQCDFLLPNEDPKRVGRLGGFYLSRSHW